MTLYISLIYFALILFFTAEVMGIERIMSSKVVHLDLFSAKSNTFDQKLKF